MFEFFLSRCPTHFLLIWRLPWLALTALSSIDSPKVWNGVASPLMSTCKHREIQRIRVSDPFQRPSKSSDVNCFCCFLMFLRDGNLLRLVGSFAKSLDLHGLQGPLWPLGHYRVLVSDGFFKSSCQLRAPRKQNYKEIQRNTLNLFWNIPKYAEICLPLVNMIWCELWASTNSEMYPSPSARCSRWNDLMWTSCQWPKVAKKWTKIAK